MSYSVTVRRLAEQDLADAEDWYDDQRRGLGTEFRAAVEAVVARLSQNPLAYPAVHGGVRRAVLTRFPYLLYFIIRNDSVEVLACLHSSRSPKLHDSRIR